MKPEMLTIHKQMNLKIKRQRFVRIHTPEMKTTIQQRMNLKPLRINHVQVEVERAGMVEVVAAHLIETERLAMVRAVVEKVRNIGL